MDRPFFTRGPDPASHVVTFVPHALSLCGLTCGFLSLIASSMQEFSFAAAFVIAAVFFDGFDGAAARALHCEGPFGETLDSLADLIAFGAAPAFLLYMASLRLFGTPGAFAGAFFVACGAIRLARFPLVKRKGYFVGLPIPMGGAFIAMLGVYASTLPAMLVPAATIITGLLMVSTIHFPYFRTAFGPLPAPARWAIVLTMAPLLFIVAPKAILFLLAFYLFLGTAGAVRVAIARDQ